MNRYFTVGALLSRLILIFTFLFLINSSSTAQSKSNKGKDFWVGFMKHREGSGSRTSLYITSDSSTTGTVSVPGQSWSQSFSVTANAITVVTIPSTYSYNDCSDCITSKGVHITSAKDVIVYAHHYQDDQSDATLVLPTRTLGKNYFIVGYNQVSFGSSGRNTFGIVAVKDDTKIKITPNQTISKNGGGTLAANVPYYITLDAGEFYQGVASSGAFSADLTGSSIEVIDTGSTANCRTIAVFSGSSYLSINSGCGGLASGDNLIEQMYPTNSWGSRFVLVPALGRTGDNYRFIASEDKTEVIVFNTGSAPDILYLDKGEFGEITNETKIRNVIATKPIMAVQFQRTASCDGGFGSNLGDPSMTVLNPLEQTLKDITLYSSQYYDIDNHYINVVIPTSATSTFTVDGASKSFTTVPNNANYSYSRFQVSAGTHRLKAAAGFIATAYGEGRYESYGYAAGANIKDLTAKASVSNSTQNTISATCLGRPTKFKGSAEYTATKWEWDFGDGNTSTSQNPTHIYKDTGTFTAKLYVYKPSYDGCSNYDSAFVEVNVYDNPVAKIAYGSICDSSFVTFNDVSIIPTKEERLTSIWNIDNDPTKYTKDITHYFDTIGKFQLRMEVITKNQCKDTILDSLFVNPNPIAGFDYSDVCYFDSSYFKNTSTLLIGSIKKYDWEFSSFGGDTTESPSFFYQDSGTYTITLTVTSDSGCSNTIDHSVFKYPYFDVSFSYNDTCLGIMNEFKNTTQIDKGIFTDTMWSTSTLDTSYQFDFDKQFNSPGQYTIKLVMEQDSFCRDSFVQDVTVNPLAKPNFIVNSTCFGDSTQFVDASLLTTGNYSISWDLDDGYTSSKDSVKVLYSSGGTKTIKLKILTDKGCSTDTTENIMITNPSISDINVINICNGLTQTISSTNFMGSDSFSIYNWEINGSFVSSDSMFDYQAITVGKNYIQLNVLTKNGCSINYQDSFVVHSVQSSSFLISNECLNIPISATDFTQINSPSVIDSYEWLLDGNKISTSRNPVFNPTNVGTHVLKLRTLSSEGCIDSIQQFFEVYPLPTSSFNASNTCFGSQTNLMNTSTISAGTITSNNWSLDGKTFISSDVIYNFPSVGSYAVELITMSDKGCKDTLLKDIEIDPLPVISLFTNSDTGCIPFSLSIINNSTISSGTIDTYNYDFGDGNSGSGLNPTYTYTSPGTYQIKISAISDQGCIDSIVRNELIVVFDNPIADFVYSPDEPSTLKNSIALKDSSSLDAIQWSWTVTDKSNNVFSYEGKTTEHTFADSGIYNISLRILNKEGCFDEITKTVYVSADIFIHIPNSFSPNDDGINDTYGLSGMIQGVYKMEMDIYNLWGEKIFHSNNVNDRWDGTFEGKPVQQGVYFFKVKYTNPKQTRWFYNSGEIHLLR